MAIENNTLAEVRDVLVEVLGIDTAKADLKASTLLFGTLPEFDSMSVVLLVTALETRFGITIEDSEVTADLFETLGSVAAFVGKKRTANSAL